MFEKAKKEIIYKLLSIYLKLRHKREIIDIKKSFIDSKKILILLPSSKDQFEIALPYLPKIRDIFEGRKIVYVLLEDFQSLFKKSFHGNLFFYQQKDITYFSLPCRKIIDSLRKEKFDITICLNPVFDLFSAYTSLRSEAKLRIGLYDEKWGNYINLQVKKEGEKLLEEKYNCLVKYLYMMHSTA